MGDLPELPSQNTLLSTPVGSPESLACCREFLQDGRSSAIVGVAVTRTADQWWDDHVRPLESVPQRVSLIDIGGRARSTAASTSSVCAGLTIRPVPDPKNLTTLGVRIIECFDELAGEVEAEHIALCFGNLSALSQHVDSKPLFKFLEALTQECTFRGVHSHFHAYPEQIEQAMLNQWKILLDGIVHVDEAGDVTVKTR